MYKPSSFGLAYGFTVHFQVVVQADMEVMYSQRLICLVI